VEKPGVPAEDFHPCLVLEWNEFKPGKFAVLVVFGTSKIRPVDRGRNFIISKYETLMKAGLYRETMFDLGRSKRLPWSDRWFFTPDPKRWTTPVIGHIGDRGRTVLGYMLQQRLAAGLPTPPRPTPPPMPGSTSETD
jgi:hypothetical protein